MTPYSFTTTKSIKSIHYIYLPEYQLQHARKIKEKFAEQKTSLIVFEKTVLTFVSSKSRKSHDIDTKFYPCKDGILKNKSAILIMRFYS